MGSNISIFVGRFNPIHIGHLNTIKFISDETRKKNGTAYIGMSNSHDNDKNPLTFNQKVKYVKLAVRPFKNIEVSEEPAYSIYDYVRDLCYQCHEDGGGEVTLFAGSDRIPQYEKMCGKLLKTAKGEDGMADVKIELVETMERGSFGTYSATQMRQHVKDGDLVSFVDHCPFGSEEDNEKYGTEMFNDIKAAFEQGGGDVPQKHGEVDPEQAKATVMNMAKKVSENVNRFTGKKDKLYLIGGAVRDEILGKVPNDYDMLTTMYYKDFARMFNTTDVRLRGSRTIVVPEIDGEEYETACITKDMSVEDFLYNSDLTMGAMAKDLTTGEIIDPYGGRADMENKVINFTEFMKNEVPKGKQAGAVLRCVRFIATFGWKATEDTMAALKAFATATKGKLAVQEHAWNKEWEKIEKKGVQEKAIELFKEIGLYNYVSKKFLSSN